MANVVATGERLKRRIDEYNRVFEKWYKRCDKIVKRYEDERDDEIDGNSRFNILWSIVSTIKPACFSRLPKPDVFRRYADNDPVARVASMILERNLSREVEDHDDYRVALNQCVQDYLLVGRGTAFVRYAPKFEKSISYDPITGQQIEREGIADERCKIDYVNRRDFGHNVARTWAEVWLVWYCVHLSRKEMRERFGDKGAEVPVDTASQSEFTNGQKVAPDTVAVLCIHDKRRREIVYMARQTNTVLSIAPDELELQDFFPCPPPLYATLTNESLVPVPDFVQYQDQAYTLDELSDRIDGLVGALRIRGVYDEAVPALARLFSEAQNNDLIPVGNWSAFAEKQGLRGAIDLVEIAPIAQALNEAYKAFEQVKQQVYDITGIPDIIRGASDPRETAKAQQMKGNFGSLRVRDRQDAVVSFATKLLRILAEIMCRHYQPETLARCAAVDQFTPEDQALVEPALQLLKQQGAEGMRIEVSSDSMAAVDEEAEKQGRSEFLAATSAFLEKCTKAAQVSPELGVLSLEMLKFGVGGFKAGRQLEGTIDKAVQDMKEAIEARKNAPPPPNPEMEKLKLQQQLQQQQMQHEANLEGVRHQNAMAQIAAKGQLDMQKHAASLQSDIAKHREIQQAQSADSMASAQAEVMQSREQAAIEVNKAVQLEQIKADTAVQLEMVRGDIAMQKAAMDNQTKIEVAEISAQSTLDAAQISAAHEGAENADVSD